MWSLRKKLDLPSAGEALPGRDTAIVELGRHAVLGTPMAPPFPDGAQVLLLGMGCFWGAERLLWQAPGVYTTAAGYSGGISPNPTYEEVCSGGTGHAEVVRVVYEAGSTAALLKLFWESHDPTQGMRQGNDVGTQYRSAIYVTTPEQEAAARQSRDAYAAALAAAGRGAVSTEILPAGPFYPAEEYHQQYLHKVPNGYCGIGGTGVSCPIGLDVPAQVEVLPPSH